MTSEVKTRFGEIVKAGFEPVRGLHNPHMQTILPKFFLATPDIKYVNERIVTPDNDFIDLAWAMPNKHTKLRGLVVLFHGLEGSSQSHYIKHQIKALLGGNFGCVVMHFRGCSGEPNLTPRAYHSGATFDPEFLIPLLKKRYLDIPFFAIGFSLGGNMLMKLMANRPDLPVDACVCVSAPLDLSASSEAINQGFSSVYQRHLMKSMKRNLLEKMAIIDMSQHIKLSTKQIENMQTFKEFDNNITAVLHGFDDAADYYHKCSALFDLPNITKPSLIIHAADDPFMDKRVIPDLHLLNRHIAYELSKHGGHVGFLNTLSGLGPHWLPSRVTHFINEILC